MHVTILPAWCLQSSEECIQSPGTGVRDDYEAPYGCWDLNLGLLKALLTEPSIQPFPTLSLKAEHQGLKVKNTRHSSREPGVDSQQQHGGCNHL